MIVVGDAQYLSIASNVVSGDLISWGLYLWFLLLEKFVHSSPEMVLPSVRSLFLLATILLGTNAYRQPYEYLDAFKRFGDRYSPSLQNFGCAQDLTHRTSPVSFLHRMKSMRKK